VKGATMSFISKVNNGLINLPKSKEKNFEPVSLKSKIIANMADLTPKRQQTNRLFQKKVAK